MNTKFFALLSLAFLVSCSNNEQETTENKITQVENNLIPPIHIEGDSTWNILDRMEHYGVPGVSLAVIENGEIAWSKSYGTVDKESGNPVTEKTLFQAASISKPVSAYAALRLVEEGKIDLTQDVNSQLQSWKVPDNEFTSEKKVTVKNLLNHSAGITVHGFLGYSPGLEVPTLTQVLNGEPPANSQPAVVDKTPEESFRYSGGGYNIVQQLMIDIEGKTYPEIMKEKVLDPLDMNLSSFNQPLNESQIVHAATGYLPDGTMTKGRRHTYPEMAAAGLWTNAKDLAKFATNIQKTLQGDSSVGLSKETTELMLTPFVEDNVGIGIFLLDKKGETYFGHGGWNEGFSSDMVAHKTKGYGAVVMINSNHPDFINELIRSVALTYQWDAYVPSYQAQEVNLDVANKIAGRYQTGGNDFITIALSDNQLSYQGGPEQEPVQMIQISDSTYVIREMDVLFQFKAMNLQIPSQ